MKSNRYLIALIDELVDYGRSLDPLLHVPLWLRLNDFVSIVVGFSDASFQGAAARGQIERVLSGSESHALSTVLLVQEHAIPDGER